MEVMSSNHAGLGRNIYRENFFYISLRKPISKRLNWDKTNSYFNKFLYSKKVGKYYFKKLMHTGMHFS